METLLRIGLSNAVVALVMALVVITAACVWRRPAVLHALWLLVLIKLVTPPLMWVPVPWPMAADSPAAVVAAAVDSTPSEPLPEDETAIIPDAVASIETPAVETGVLEVQQSGDVPRASGARASRVSGGRLDARTPLAYAGGSLSVCATCAVWLAGAFAWYVLALFRLRRFRRLLRHAVPAPESLRQRTQRLAEKLRLRQCPALWLVPGRVAPMLWAAGGRPRILFPADLLKQIGVEQQNALLVHELAHLRRRDHWVRWLEFATAGLYWWNPVLWFARRELREAEEQCCDAWVTSTMPGAAKTYATALLETVDFLSDAPSAAPLLASGVGRVVDLKRRLTMIMRGTTPRALGWRGLAAVVGIGALLLPMLPAWGQAQPQTSAPAKAEKTKKPNVDVFKYPDASPADLERARAELKMCEAVLGQKKAEVAEAAVRVAAARARVQQDEGAARAPQGGGAAKTAAGEGAWKYSIVVEVPGAAMDQAGLRDLIKQLEAVHMRGASQTLIAVDEDSGKVFIKRHAGQAPPPPAGMRWIEPGDKGWRPGQPPLAVAAADTDKRIIDMEMKLHSLLDEVTQLRRERTPDLPSRGPGPADATSALFDQIYKQVVASPKALPQNAAMQERLKAEAQRLHDKANNTHLFMQMQERLKAEAQKLAAERDATQAKLRMLEEEIRQLQNSQSGQGPAKP